MLVARMVITFAVFFSIFTAAKAASPVPHQTKMVFISQDCKSMYYGLTAMEFGEAAARKRPTYVAWDSSRAKPMAYQDLSTSIIFYTESDGRHIVAIGGDGKLLWVRDPYSDARFCPYRTPRPIIAKIYVIALNDYQINILKSVGADTSHSFLRIEFDSSQYGIMDEVSGDFFPEGQN